MHIQHASKEEQITDSVVNEVEIIYLLCLCFVCVIISCVLEFLRGDLVYMYWATCMCSCYVLGYVCLCL